MATNKIELKSEEVRELLKTPPSWLVRWGSLILLLLLFLLLLFSVFFTFSKVEIIPLNLVRNQELIPVFLPSDGQIKYWFKNEADSIFAGEPIALLSNQAEYIDVLALEERLSRFEPEEPSSFKDFGDLDALRLGELATDLKAFEDALKGDKKIAQPKQSKSFRAKQIKAIEQLLKQLEPEYSNLSQSYQQQKEAFKIAQDDYASGRLSEVRLREIGRNLEKLEKRVVNLEAEIKERKDSLEVIKKEVGRNPKSEVVFDIDSIKAAFENLKTKLNQWKSEHLIYAGTSGKLIELSRGQKDLMNGNIIANIQTFGGQSLIAETTLNQEQKTHLKEGHLFLKVGAKKETPLKISDWKLEKDESSQSEKIQISLEGLEDSFIKELNNSNPELKIEWGSESLLSRLWNDYSK